MYSVYFLLSFALCCSVCDTKIKVKQVKPKCTKTVAQKPQESPTPTSAAFDISLHHSLTDCWVVYEQKIYDISIWIPNHPGGKDVYSSLCGTNNFELAFKEKHGDSQVSTFFLKAVLV